MLLIKEVLQKICVNAKSSVANKQVDGQIIIELIRFNFGLVRF